MQFAAYLALIGAASAGQKYDGKVIVKFQASNIQQAADEWQRWAQQESQKPEAQELAGTIM